jgi:N-methylhydantoinase A/acetophenone carboxylase
VYEEFEKEFADAFSPHVVNRPGGVHLDAIVLKATVLTEKLDLPTYPVEAADSSAARTSTRSASWPELGERRDTEVSPSTRSGPAMSSSGRQSSRWSTRPSSSRPASR